MRKCFKVGKYFAPFKTFRADVVCLDLTRAKLYYLLFFGSNECLLWSFMVTLNIKLVQFKNRLFLKSFASVKSSVNCNNIKCILLDKSAHRSQWDLLENNSHNYDSRNEKQGVQKIKLRKHSKKKKAIENTDKIWKSENQSKKPNIAGNWNVI